MNSNLEPEGIHSEVVSTVNTSADNSSVSVPITTSIISTTSTVKKVKKEKDPQAPKRPLNAYFLFSRDCRQRFKEENPKITFVELTKMTNEAWEAIDAETKAKYEAESKGLFEEFNKQMKEYNKLHGTSETKTTSGANESSEPKTNEIATEKPSALEIPIVIASATSSDEPAPSQDHQTEDSGSQEPKKKKKKNKHNRESESTKEQQQQ